MFLFHQLSTSERKSILGKVATSLIRIHDTIQSNMKTYPPLLVSHLLVILDYIFHQFDEPSTICLQIIEANLLNINLRPSGCANDKTKIHLVRTGQFQSIQKQVNAQRLSRSKSSTLILYAVA